MEMGKVRGVVSTRHVLILSMAVNLGLLLRVVPEAWSWEGFCLENSQNGGGASDDFSATEAKVSKTVTTRSSSLSSSVASTGVTDGGDSVVINKSCLRSLMDVV